VASSDHKDEAIAAYKKLYGVTLTPSDVEVLEGAADYETALKALQSGSFDYEEGRAKAAGTIDDALPPTHPRRKTYETYTSRVGEGSAYDRLESGKPREQYRDSNPEVDATLWVLGKTTVVRTAQAQQRARQLFHDLWGYWPPTPRLSRR
jgi:hypothetical protein